MFPDADHSRASTVCDCGNPHPCIPCRADLYESSLHDQSVTIFIPLSGRCEYWDRTRLWLESQEWQDVRLIICDTSQDFYFSEIVRSWMCQSDFSAIQYYWQPVGTPGLAELPRWENKDVMVEVNLAMCQIYNRMLKEVSTEFVLVIEDDNFPCQLDTIEQMLRVIGTESVSVNAPYHGRHNREFEKNRFCMWERGKHIEEPGDGVQLLDGGTGFGCTMFRMSILARENVEFVAKPHYDVTFFRDFPRRWQVLVHWGLQCDHAEMSWP